MWLSIQVPPACALPPLHSIPVTSNPEVRGPTPTLADRVIPGFLVQFGVASTPDKQAVWEDKSFEDEPNVEPFRHGTVSFAGNGKDSRSCHLFVALQPHGSRLGNAPHETTIGQVEMDDMPVWNTVVSNFAASGYGDTGELQQDLVARGNAAAAAYPKLDRIERCWLVDSKSEL